ncbi:MAG: tRNA lysidine(34) synthetase TilS [Prochlorococcaceae cyanobacterium]
MGQVDQDGAILPPQALERAWSREHLRLHRWLLQQPALLPQGAPLLLAVSGGQDSMALLGLLLGLQRLHDWRLYLWHGDHGWRSDSSQQARGLAAWCQTHQLKVHVEHHDAAHKPPGAPSSTSEAGARQWRYQALEAHAKACGCSHVVTGHTASDRAETLLLNLARGSHRRGLASLPSQRPLDGNGEKERGASAILLSRPLLIFSRDETGQICRDLQLPIWLDPSNDDRRFSRNRLRHEVLPVLEQLHPGAVRRLSSTAERLQQEQRCINEWVEVALQWLQSSEQGPGLQLQRQRLTALQPANQAAILERWLGQHGTACANAKHLRAVVQRLQQGRPPGQINLNGGWQLRWNSLTLELIAPTQQAP